MDSLVQDWRESKRRWNKAFEEKTKRFRWAIMVIGWESKGIISFFAYSVGRIPGGGEEEFFFVRGMIPTE